MPSLLPQPPALELDLALNLAPSLSLGAYPVMSSGKTRPARFYVSMMASHSATKRHLPSLPSIPYANSAPVLGLIQSGIRSLPIHPRKPTEAHRRLQKLTETKFQLGSAPVTPSSHHPVILSASSFFIPSLRLRQNQPREPFRNPPLLTPPSLHLTANLTGKTFISTNVFGPPYDLTAFSPPYDTPGAAIMRIVAPLGPSLDLLGV
jgi:hypothetical protein